MHLWPYLGHMYTSTGTSYVSPAPSTKVAVCLAQVEQGRVVLAK